MLTLAIIAISDGQFCTQAEAIEVTVRGLVGDLSTVTINYSYSTLRIVTNTLDTTQGCFYRQ